MEPLRNPNPKRPLEVEDVSLDSPSSKRLRPEELLELLEHDGELSAEEPGAGEERDLESVIRSFEEEIAGEDELGFLLHASDDELGLPPPCDKEEAPEKVVEVGGEVVELSDDVAEKVADVEGGFDNGLLGWCDEGLYVPLDLSDLTWQSLSAV